MANLITKVWQPNYNRVVNYYPRPDWIPDWLYNEALAAKRQYNAGWEQWVSDVAQNHKVSFEEAEIACIKGISNECKQLTYVYGPKYAKWFVDFLEMETIFDKVKNISVDSKGIENG